MTDHYRGDAVDLYADPETIRHYVDRVLRRAPGLSLTSGSRPERKNMPLQNPYDRRNRPRADGVHDFSADAVDRGHSIDRELRRAPALGYSAHSGRPLYDVAMQRLEMADEVDVPGLTLRDIEQLVAMKVKRARRDGDDAAYMRSRQEVVDAQREAWAEGADAGARERGLAVHQAIENEVGGAIHDLHVRAVAIVDADPKTKAGREFTTKAALLEFAKRVAEVTDAAIKTHGRELRVLAETGHMNPDVPF